MPCITPGSCFDKDCCQPQDFEYSSHEVVIWQIADFGTGDANETAVAAVVQADVNYDLVFSSGDNNYSNSPYAFVVGTYYPLSTNRAKFWPVPGNHDWDFDGTLAAYLAYFQSSPLLTAPRRYYNQRWGCVEVFFVDSGWNSAGTLLEPDGNTAGTLDADNNPTGGSAQWRWFVRAVNASKARWKVVVLHHPPYSSGNGHTGQPNVTAPGSYTALRWQFKKLGVDLVIAGHEHSYERLVVDSVTYVVNGLGGQTKTGFGTPIAGSQFRYNTDFGALRLSVTEDAIRGVLYNTSSAAVDTFTLTK